MHLYSPSSTFMFVSHLFDLKKKEKPCINTLMGHSGAVVDISWSYDESLLASCDINGMVILWTRRINNRS